MDEKGRLASVEQQPYCLIITPGVHRQQQARIAFRVQFVHFGLWETRESECEGIENV